MVATTIAEKEQLFRDIWNGKTPARIPVVQGVDIALAIDKKGLNLVKDQFSVDRCLEAVDYITSQIDSDILPLTTPSCFAADIMLGSRKMIMSSGGFMQHQNICVMEENEYPLLTADPYAFIMDVVLPRLYTSLNGEKEHDAYLLMKAKMMEEAFFSKYMPGRSQILKKYERCRYDFNIGQGIAPFDDIADYLRSFSNVSKDIRRRPQEVLDAVDAMTEYELKRLSLMAPGREGGRVFFALHMATFMRESDFAKFWWPSYKQVLNYLVDTNRGISMFCEEKWDRFMDYLVDVPKDSLIWFEKTDIDLAVSKLGKEKVLTGMFPIEMYTNKNTQEVVDYTRAFIDKVGPTGRYQFKANKSPLRGSDVDLDTMKTVIEVVKECGVY